MENDLDKDLDLELEEDTELEPQKEAPANGEDADLKARLEQLEQENKKLKRKLFVKPKSPSTLPTNINKNEIPNEIIADIQSLKLSEQKRQFGYEHGLSPEETDWIFQATGGKPTKDALEVPFIKHGLEGYRASKRVEANTPGSSARGSVFAGKNFEELSKDDRAQLFAEKVKQIRK